MDFPVTPWRLDRMGNPKIFLSAGEASGEHYGALLMTEIDRLAPGSTFFGLGGRRMESLGLRRIVRAEDVAVMGITEVIRHMPHIYREYRRLKASLRTERPNLAILIDFPDVNLSLAKTLHRLNIPVVFFVSPQLWAWKKYRVHSVKKYVNRMLVIFPFEKAFYKGHGIDADFVGHPLADLERPAGSREDFARQNELESSKPWIGVLPGSRFKELAANLPPMIEAAALLGPNYEYLMPVAPTLQMADVRALVERLGGSTIRLVQDARAVLQNARASMVASGTATIEAALIGNPFVVVYRVSRLTYAVAQRVIQLPHVAMVNLIAGRRMVPELIQDEFTASNVVKQLLPLLEDGEARATMQSDLRGIETALQLTGDARGANAIERVARTALDLLAARQTSPPHSVAV
jgi:lipid-A-disaccharide synthase